MWSGCLLQPQQELRLLCQNPFFQPNVDAGEKPQKARPFGQDEADCVTEAGGTLYHAVTKQLPSTPCSKNVRVDSGRLPLYVMLYEKAITRTPILYHNYSHTAQPAERHTQSSNHPLLRSKIPRRGASQGCVVSAVGRTEGSWIPPRAHNYVEKDQLAHTRLRG